MAEKRTRRWLLQGQLRLSGCFECNVQEEHNYTGMGILKYMVGSHWGVMWPHKGGWVCECARAWAISSTHVESCKLWFDSCQHVIWHTGSLTCPTVQQWVTQRQARRKTEVCDQHTTGFGWLVSIIDYVTYGVPKTSNMTSHHSLGDCSHSRYNFIKFISPCK